MLVATLATMSAPRTSAQTPNLPVSSTPNLMVSSMTNTGAALASYWIEVTDTSGNVIQTGFTPANFTLSAGSYIVFAGDYGPWLFNSWSDGSVSRGHAVAVTLAGSVSLIAIYCGSTGCGKGGLGGSSILVASQYSDGSALVGMYTTLQQGSSVVATGFTPATFSSLTSGQNYSVTAHDYTMAYFSQWSNGLAARTTNLIANGSQRSLTAIYCKTPGCYSSTGGGGAPGTMTVTSSDLVTGLPISGMYVDLRLNNNHVDSGFTPVTFSGLAAGTRYLVVVYSYAPDYFRHFSNGNLQRYSYVTLNTTVGQTSLELNALYENVPTANAASLNIIAQFPNGTQIGTASEISGYPQHTPGMYLTVSPPGSGTPYTATFTGGSALPFIFFNGQAYTVSMSSGYSNVHFDHWKDNASTDPVRTIPLQGDSSYIAVYVQR